MSKIHLQEILDVRSQIDTIDSNIVSLLKKRIKLAQKIGCLKDKDKRVKWDPQREKEIYQQLLLLNEQTFPEKALLSIFHEIITSCRLAQQKTLIAFQGSVFSLPHFAAIKYFGSSGEFIPAGSIEGIFSGVAEGSVHYGIVPFENTPPDFLTEALLCFTKYKGFICGETQLPLSYNLISQSGNSKDIQSIAGDLQSLSFCRKWLLKTHSSLPVLYVDSAEEALARAAENPAVAAVASSLMEKNSALQIITKGIEDNTGDTTRFLIIGNAPTVASGMDKTTLLFGIESQSAVLSHILSVLHEEKINLLKIEFCPAPGSQWKYHFLVDVEGHMENENIKKGCDRLKKIYPHYRWLGSYPLSRASSANT